VRSGNSDLNTEREQSFSSDSKAIQPFAEEARSDDSELNMEYKQVLADSVSHDKIEFLDATELHE